jgi:alanine or glycine:cation symporter, AGCS family
MNFLLFLNGLNIIIGIPFALLFLAISILFTLKLGIPQIFAFKRFITFVTTGLSRQADTTKTINAFHALFTSMATSIGIGTIVGPSLAIVAGGPGALFWLLSYAFFGSVTKLVEVTFALVFRKKTEDGRILGGPAEYLKVVHPFLAYWYGFTTLFLFAGWSGIQSKALAEIGAQRGVPEWITGMILALVIFFVLLGGAQRVSAFASKLVPLMFAIYVTFSLIILVGDFGAVVDAIRLVAHSIFSPAAAVGGFLGATVYAAIKEGTFKAVFITESGMGTASIAHSMSDVKNPIDQGILAMYSGAADGFLCLLSGLLILTSGVWKQGTLSNTLILQVFENKLPVVGPFFFITSVVLFISTTALGNSFNGGQSFATFTKYRWIRTYYAFAALVIFASSLVEVPLVWAIMDLVLPLVALPNLIGLVILTFRYPSLLCYKQDLGRSMSQNAIKSWAKQTTN